MIEEKLKRKFSNLYKKRKSFYEQHKNLAEQIGFTRWQENEFFQYFYKGTKEFEKENVKLKEQNLKDCEAFNKTMKEIKEQWKKEHSQFIEAKELLNEFLRLHYNPIVDERTLFHKVEQFLRDSDIDGAIQQANEGLNFDRIADEMEQDLKDNEVEK